MKFVFAVYDRAAESFGNPMTTPSRGLAIRSFMDEVNRPAENNPLYNHSGDFELHLLAAYDDSSGQFLPLDDRGLVMSGKAAKAQD